MNTTATAIKEENRAKQQAVTQLESIVEMVAGLDRESAAELFVKTLSRDRCAEILTANGIEYLQDVVNDYDELAELVAEALTDESFELDDFEFDEEKARETIQEDPLSVQVRSGWYSPGDSESAEAEEFEVLLCTGGPAVRIIGELGRGNQPENPRIQYQDWGTPWIEYFPSSKQREALQTYCEQFYYGD